ncbi:hypothetical protein VTJ49DRAFT_2665 [Mycothermus thermophilus]|uniref:OCRE domain-containing protein n=1 Tax=Humicola insolens TaxID=85995 RepID=A0ABR3VA63_HUMIN
MEAWKKAFKMTPEEVRDASPPGTVELREDDTLVLVPAPTADPADPLNWAAWRKAVCMLTVAFYAFVANFVSASMAPALPMWNRAFPHDRRQMHDLSMLVAFNVLMVGLGNVVWVPFANVLGRRHALFLSTGLLAAATVVGLHVPGFRMTMVVRILQGLGSSASETIVPAVVGDLFFVHERGRWMALYTACLTSGSVIGGISGGYIASNMGWNGLYLVTGILSGVAHGLTILFVPESMYDRPQNPPRAPEQPRNGDQAPTSGDALTATRPTAEMDPPGSESMPGFNPCLSLGTLPDWRLSIPSFRLSGSIRLSSLSRFSGFSGRFTTGMDSPTPSHQFHISRPNTIEMEILNWFQDMLPADRRRVSDTDNGEPEPERVESARLSALHRLTGEDGHDASPDPDPYTLTGTTATGSGTTSRRHRSSSGPANYIYDAATGNFYDPETDYWYDPRTNNFYPPRIGRLPPPRPIRARDMGLGDFPSPVPRPLPLNLSRAPGHRSELIAHHQRQQRAQLAQQLAQNRRAHLNAPNNPNLPPREFPAYTFLRSLKFSPYRGHVLRQLAKPWTTLLLPATWVIMLQYGGLVGGVAVVSTVGPQILSAPPYRWGKHAGLLFVGALVGILLGGLCTGLVADRWVAKAAKQAENGRVEPEERVGIMLPALAVGTAGLVVFGFCARFPTGLGYVGLETAFAMLAFALAQVPSIWFGYLIDSFDNLASDCFTMICILRGLIPFAWTFFVAQWVEKDGYLIPFVGFGCILGAFGLLTIPIQVWGKRMRIATAGYVMRSQR